jgi:hypothetical protein
MIEIVVYHISFYVSVVLPIKKKKNWIVEEWTLEG